MPKHVQFLDGTTTSDNAVARYDATANTFVQDSEVFINDSGYLHGGAANTELTKHINALTALDGKIEKVTEVVAEEPIAK